MTARRRSGAASAPRPSQGKAVSPSSSDPSRTAAMPGRAGQSGAAGTHALRPRNGGQTGLRSAASTSPSVAASASIMARKQASAR